MSLRDKIKIISRNRLTDDRGWFLKTINGLEEGLPRHTGEVYVTSALPGKSRGGHYHVLATEWFTIVCGICKVYLADVTTGERVEMVMSFDNPRTLRVPPGIAHLFENTGEDDFILAAYSDELYDPQDTIPFDFG